MVFWVTAFLDFPADEFDAEIAFWSDVTGYAVSPSPWRSTASSRP